MIPIHAVDLAAVAMGVAVDPSTIVDVPEGERCAASGVALAGRGVRFAASTNFGDHFHLADDAGLFVSPATAAVMAAPQATNAGGSGVASADGFVRLLSNRSRLAFLMDPPSPPFAVAIVNAKRQHVWWMARTAYDRDLIPVQYGHRRLVVDRPRAIAAARIVLAYESDALLRDGRPTYVFVPLGPDQNRDLKHPDFGQPTPRFQKDATPEADAVRSTINDLSIGDLWAAMQIRAAVRETRTTTIEEAVAHNLAIEAEEAQKDASQ